MPEQEPKPKEGEDGNLPQPVVDVLKDIKTKVDALSNPKQEIPKGPTVDSVKEQRESERKAMGFTEEQMQAHERSIARAQAPVYERTAWTHLDKKPDIETYRKEIEDELKIYRPEQKTPDLLDKIYFMVRGKHADSKPAPKEPAKPTGVERTRVSGGPGYTGNEPGLTGGKGEGGGGEEEQLDDREKFVTQKLREAGIEITEKDYAKSRNAGRNIRELKVPDARPANSLADVELRRLTSKR